MKALEKLRESSHLDDCKWTLETGEVVVISGGRPSDLNAVNWGEQWRKIADEIEAEVAEKYMKLPVDADGVPIRPGDELEYCSKDIIHANGENLGNVSGRCKVEYIAFNEFDEIAIQTDEDEDADAAPAFFPSYGYDSMNYRHAKPRTLEDVIYDIAINSVQIERYVEGVPVVGVDMGQIRDGIEQHEGELRELMEVDR